MMTPSRSIKLKKRLEQSERFAEAFKKDRESAEKAVNQKVERLRALRVAKEAADKEEAARRAAMVKSAVKSAGKAATRVKA